MLIMLPCYIDGEQLLDSTQICPLYNLLTLGILNQKAHDQEIFSSLGYQPNVEVARSRGRIMLNSGHADGIMAQDVLEQEGSRKEGKEVHNSTDYHHTC
jgi:hypothetical protein